MNLFDLNRLIKDSALVNYKIENYIEKGILKKQPLDKSEIEGHIEKAKHNLDFVLDNMRMNHYDWCITGCYYAVYHAALALLIQKGYTSKNHDATLCILIKEYLNQDINEKDIELINSFFLDYQDLLFYVQSKNKREEASYSTRKIFDKNTVEDLRIKAILFIDKAKEIIENTKKTSI